MTIYLERNDVVAGGGIACGFPLIIADESMLQSAVDRAEASVFGEDAYPTLEDKAAALLHSLARNDALVDGNKRTAWVAAWAFLRLNGIDLPDVYEMSISPSSW